MASLLLNGLNRSEGVYPTSKVGAPSVAKRRVEGRKSVDVWQVQITWTYSRYPGD